MCLCGEVVTPLFIDLFLVLAVSVLGIAGMVYSVLVQCLWQAYLLFEKVVKGSGYCDLPLYIP